MDLDAGDGVNITKGAAPTVDVFTINGGTSATDGVDALQLTFTGSNASGNVIDITPAYSVLTNADTLNVIDIDAFTTTADAATATVRALNIGAITESLLNAGVVTSTAINIGATWDTILGGTTAGTNLIGFTNFTVTSAGAGTFGTDLTVTGGDVIGSNSDRIDIGEAADATITLTRNDAGTVTLTSADDDATAALTIVGGGTTTLSIGDSGDTLAFTGVDMNFAIIDGQTLNLDGDGSPTADLVTIGSGDTSATDGVDALQLTFTGSSASGNVIDITPAYSVLTNADTLNVIDIDAFTTTADAATATVRALNIGAITESLLNAGVVTSTAINIGATWDTILGGTTAGTNLIGFTNFTVTSAGAGTFGTDLTVTGGDVIGSNSDRIDIGEAADATITLTRNDAGTVTLTSADDDATAALTIVGGGTTTLSIGDSGDTLAFTGVDMNFAIIDGQTLNLDGDGSPTADLVTIGSGDTSATANVDGLNITLITADGATGSTLLNLNPTFAATAASTFNVMNVAAFTATSTTNAMTVRGLNIDAITESLVSGGTIASTGISIGATWDDAININSGTFI
ncbi:MAG: hypothetical protein AABX82_09470, partial [Nanoarchaeota archaeon]